MGAQGLGFRDPENLTMQDESLQGGPLMSPVLLVGASGAVSFLYRSTSSARPEITFQTGGLQLSQNLVPGPNILVAL